MVVYKEYTEEFCENNSLFFFRYVQWKDSPAESAFKFEERRE